MRGSWRKGQPSTSRSGGNTPTPAVSGSTGKQGHAKQCVLPRTVFVLLAIDDDAQQVLLYAERVAELADRHLLAFEHEAAIHLDALLAGHDRVCEDHCVLIASEETELECDALLGRLRSNPKAK